jgi:hypothetical protein
MQKYEENVAIVNLTPLHNSTNKLPVRHDKVKYNIRITKLC